MPEPCTAVYKTPRGTIKCQKEVWDRINHYVHVWTGVFKDDPESATLTVKWGNRPI